MHSCNGVNPARTHCADCRLRSLVHFRDFESAEVEFIDRFKVGEVNVDRGATILLEGTHSAHLYTVLHGWGFRYKTLEDGRRQVLNYVMPGDLIGLQGSLVGEMQHSVEALTPCTLCIFERENLMKLYREHPGLAFDITWIAAREERILDEHLLSMGQRTALERAAYLLAFLNRRAANAGLFDGNRRAIPITQHHVADTLGLSAVHTNKTLRKLAARKLIRWLDRGCEVLDDERLVETAGWSPERESKRRFI